MNPQKAINFNVFSEAYNIVKEKWQPFVIAGAIAIVAILVVECLFYIPLMAVILTAKSAAIFAIFPIYGLLYFVIFFMSSMMQAGFMNMSLKAIRQEPIEVADFLEPIKTPVPFLITSLLLTVAMMIGMIACFVGAYVVAALTMFTYPLMFDKKLAPMDAFKESIEMLKSQWLMATGFWFVAVLVGGIGSLACGIGAIFTIPITYVAIALCYRDLAWDSDGVSPADAAPIVVPVTPAPDVPVPDVTTADAPTPEEEAAAAKELSTPVPTEADIEPEPPKD